MTPAIEAQQLSKVFRDFWRRPHVKAVNAISLVVSPGTIHGLLGPNGSGKSTTLKMLLGLLHPSSGQVRILGDRPRKPAVLQRIGYLPEVSTMYRYLNAEETLRFYGALFQLPPSVCVERTRELLDLVGLAQDKHRPVGEFSRGMNRRLGIAQALINNPDVLVLDEPTAGLDPIGCHHVKNLLRILSAAGKTVLIASHLLADIEDICHAITILHHGNVIASGTMDALLTEDESVIWRLGKLPPEQQEALQKACLEMTGQTPTLSPHRTHLEDFFIQSVVAAGQPAQAAPPPRSAGSAIAGLPPNPRNNIMIRAVSAIMYLTLRQAWASRSILGLGMAALVPAVIFPLIIKGDNTPTGAYRMLMTYAPMGLFALLLSGSIWLGAFALATERLHLQFAMLKTKPVRGVCIWLGKWLGVCMVLLLVLTLSGSIFAAMLHLRRESLVPASHAFWLSYAPDEQAIWQQARRIQSSRCNRLSTVCANSSIVLLPAAPSPGRSPCPPVPPTPGPGDCTTAGDWTPCGAAQSAEPGCFWIPPR